MNKKVLRQFNSTNAAYILQNMIIPTDVNIIEPFAGNGDLVTWVNRHCETYDIDPTKKHIVRDCLMNPPSYKNKFILTNPPYLARNKSCSKIIYDKWKTNDLYKCFIKSFIKDVPIGVLMIIPIGFLCSIREADVELRELLFNNFTVERINIFEEQVFDDTSCAICSILLKQYKNLCDSVSFNVQVYPSKKEYTWTLEKKYKWLLGGSIYTKLHNYKISRSVDTIPNTNLHLYALDSGKNKHTIKLEYTPGKIYKSKSSSRTEATIHIEGITLTPSQQIILADKFTTYINENRDKYCSMFLTTYRENTRKRISFNLAYTIIGNLLKTELININ